MPKVLIALFGDGLDRILSQCIVRRLGACHTPWIRTVCHHVPDLFLRYIEMLEQDQTERDSSLNRQAIDDGFNESWRQW